MSSKEALDFDGRKRRKEGSVCEKRMNAETNHITPKSIQSRSSSSSSTMSNAEIQVNKKVERTTPKKGKAVEIVRQRSDLGIKKSPPQIKRARSATSCVKEEINLVKLRKIKSDSAKVADNSLPLPLKFLDQKGNNENGVADFDEDLGIEKSRFEEEDNGQVKAIVSNAENQDLDLDLEEEEEVEEVEVEKEIEAKVEIKDIVISLEEEKKKPKNFVIEEKNLIHSKDRSPPMVEKIALAVNHARIQEKLSPSNLCFYFLLIFFSLINIFEAKLYFISSFRSSPWSFKQASNTR